MHDRGHLMESPVETVDIPSRPSRLNAAVAVSVALLSTVMGIGKVKDDNIVQAMQQAQADKLDHWSVYQARNLREEVAKATLVQLKLQAAASTPALRPQVDAAISQYEKIAADQAVKKEELRQAALADQQVYDALNYRDDQFDLSDAAIAIAISLLAIASLTQIWWLFGLAMVPAAFGTMMGIAGLAGWRFHPELLARLLG
jgi:ribosomal protein S13